MDSCTRCGKYTLEPPLCAECEKEEQRARDRAERPAPPRVSDSTVVDVAAKELGMSTEKLSRKLKKGNVMVASETTITVALSGSDPVTIAQRNQNYDALLRLANTRDVNSARIRIVIKALFFLAVMYGLAKPLARWLLR